LTAETLYPLAFKRAPSEAAVIPLPKDETTPPVTKMNLPIQLLTPVITSGLFYIILSITDHKIEPEELTPGSSISSFESAVISNFT
jgi:hypothetical protein